MKKHKIREETHSLIKSFLALDEVEYVERQGEIVVKTETGAATVGYRLKVIPSLEFASNTDQVGLALFNDVENLKQSTRLRSGIKVEIDGNLQVEIRYI